MVWLIRIDPLLCTYLFVLKGRVLKVIVAQTSNLLQQKFV
jgi:hypothetical protein